MASSVHTPSVSQPKSGLAPFRGILFACLAGAGGWVVLWHAIGWLG